MTRVGTTLFAFALVVILKTRQKELRNVQAGSGASELLCGNREIGEARDP